MVAKFIHGILGFIYFMRSTSESVKLHLWTNLCDNIISERIICLLYYFSMYKNIDNYPEGQI